MDLIGYMVKGKNELSVEEAAMRAYFDAVVQEQKRTDGRMIYQDVDQCMDDPEGLEGGDLAMWEDENTCTFQEFKEACLRFLEWWNAGCEARDTVWREFNEERVVFAGEASWGDSPSGFGYTRIHEAARFHQFKLLGIG